MVKQIFTQLYFFNKLDKLHNERFKENKRGFSRYNI